MVDDVHRDLQPMARRRDRQHGVISPEAGDRALLGRQGLPVVVKFLRLLVIFRSWILAIGRWLRGWAGRVGRHGEWAVVPPLRQQWELLLHHGAGRHPVLWPVLERVLHGEANVLDNVTAVAARPVENLGCDRAPIILAPRDRRAIRLVRKLRDELIFEGLPRVMADGSSMAEEVNDAGAQPGIERNARIIGLPGFADW